MLTDFKGAAHVYIACGYTDLRRGIDGLASIVQQQFQLDPFSNTLFLFCGRRHDRIKALYWEGDGFLLLYKRLESGSFQWPRKTVEAVLDGSCTVKVVDNSKHFDDTVNHWSKDAVAFASSHELFSGTSPNTFAPDTSMSRAMLATVLYRLEDAVATGSNAFADVPEGTWYTDAVTWASNAGIVTGTGSGFDPNGNVTREQLATMLYRYAKTLGMSTSASGDLSKFSDGNKTSSWAKDAMSWAVGSGLISGKGNSVLDPTGSATRAEVAVIM